MGAEDVIIDYWVVSIWDDKLVPELYSGHDQIIVKIELHALY